MDKPGKEKDAAFRVAVRVRPLTQLELTAEDPEKGEPLISSILCVEDNLVFISSFIYHRFSLKPPRKCQIML